MLRARIGTQLMVLVGIIFLAFASIAVLVSASFTQVSRLSAAATDTHLRELLSGADTVRRLSDLFSAIEHLRIAFRDRQDIVKTEGDRLTASVDEIAATSNNPAVRTQLADFKTKLAYFLDHCSRLNAALAARRNADRNAHDSLSRLESHISQWHIELVTAGKPTEAAEQMAALASGTREGLLMLGKTLAERRDGQGDRHTPRLPAILAQVNELSLRVQTVSAPREEIPRDAREIARNLAAYRTAVVRQEQAHGAFEAAWNELKASRDASLTQLKLIEHNNSTNASALGSQLQTLLADTQQSLVAMLALVAVAALLLTVLLVRRGINRPLQDILRDIAEIRDGRYQPSRPVAHVAEWGAIQLALRDMGRTLSENLTALRESEQRLEREVSERTAELNQQTVYLRSLIDHFPFMVWLKDSDNRYLATNLALARLCGRPIADIVGRADGDIWPQPHPLSAAEDDRKVMAERRQQTVETRIETSEGAAWTEIWKGPILGAAGEVLGTVGFARDITQHKEAEAAREMALDEARRLAAVRSEFLANMSHEIRTPLNAVLGLAQLGVRDAGHAREQNYFRRIVDSGQHLLSVVNDVLDFSKIEAGRLELECRPYVLGEVIDRSLELTASRAYGKGLRLAVRESPDLPMSVSGDALRLTQVLVNLLSNAIKFTDVGHVLLAVDLRGDRLRIRVEDTGIGMNEDTLSRLFDAFQQADSSTTRRFGGTGLGLTISHRLIQAMEGSISVYSEPGRGSKFEILLPLHTAQAASPAPSGALPAGIWLTLADDGESRALRADLVSRGVTVHDGLPDARVHGLSALVILDAAGGADGAARLRSLTARGLRIALAAVPGEAGGRPPVAPELDLPLLDRPLRARRLALALQHPHAPVAEPGGGAAGRLRGLRVLAAEDVEVNRMILAEMLESEGATVRMAHNGVDALRIVHAAAAGAEGAFDVVLTDIQMPEMDGYELARRLTAMGLKAPVIALTAHAMAEERARCLAAGMVGHISKPVDFEQLVAIILRHVPTRTPDSTPPPPGPAAAPPQAATASAALDWDALVERCQGKVSLATRLLRVAVTSQQEVPARLRQAAGAADFESLHFMAHSLKGAAGNLAAGELAELAKQTDLAARAQSAEAVALANALADALTRFLAAVEARLAAAEAQATAALTH